MEKVVGETEVVQRSSVMLTGNQIAAARRLANIGTQDEMAKLAGVSRPTIERAESAKGEIPSLRVDQMVKIIRGFETAGVEFFLAPGSSLIGGIGLRMKKR